MGMAAGQGILVSIDAMNWHDGVITISVVYLFCFVGKQLTIDL